MPPTAADPGAGFAAAAARSAEPAVGGRAHTRAALAAVGSALGARRCSRRRGPPRRRRRSPAWRAPRRRRPWRAPTRAGLPRRSRRRGLASGGLGALERDDATSRWRRSTAAMTAGTRSRSLPSRRSACPRASALRSPRRASRRSRGRRTIPVDMFAPPDAESDELKVDIAADEQELSAQATAHDRPPAAPPLARARPQSRLAIGAARRRSRRSRASSARSPNERVRTIAGVVLAILIGFLPAHLIARSREASAYRELDTQLVSLQAQAETPEAWASSTRRARRSSSASRRSAATSR